MYNYESTALYYTSTAHIDIACSHPILSPSRSVNHTFMHLLIVHILLHLCTMSVCAHSAYSQLSAEQPVDSSKVAYWLEEGDTHYQQFDNRLALDEYFKAHEEDPTSFDVLTRISRTANDYALDLLADNLQEEALESFNEALMYASSLEQLFPDNPQTHYHLARIKVNLALLIGGRDKIQFGREVESHCAKGIDLDPDSPELYVTYAVFNRDIADMNWVERTFTVAIFGKVPDGSPETALSLLEKAVDLNPDLHLAQYEIARTYLSMGRHDEAEPYLQKAVDMPAQTTQDNRNRQIARRMLDRLKN